MKKDFSNNFSSVDRLRRTVLIQIRRPYEALSRDQRFWIGFVLLSLITTMLISNPAWRSSTSEYQEGEIARESIIAPADISDVDTDATEKLKANAAEGIRNIFVYQKNRPDDAAQNFRTHWDKLLNSSSKKDGEDKSKTAIEWPGPGGEELGRIFAARRFGNNELDQILSVLRNSSDATVYDDRDRNFLSSEITLIDRQQPTMQSVVSAPATSWTSLSQARAGIQPALEKIASLSETEVEAFASALSPLVNANVAFDSVATQKAKNDMIKSVEPVSISLKRGQTVVREGDTITTSALSQIAAIRNYSSSTRQWNRFFGLLAIITALFWVAWKFVQHRGYVTRLALTEEMTYALFGFIILIQTVLMALFFRIADFTAAQNLRAPLNDPTLWALAIPFAFSSLLMTLLADRRTALFTGLFTAMIGGLLAPKGLEFALYAAISSAVAVYGIGRYRSRQSVTTAGTMVGAACALTAVAIIAYTQQPFILNTVLLAMSCGLASGLVTAAITAVFLPICETLFGILTDVKLLELSNADLPVLGQLALRAPGTNQHSHAVGQLAEEACRIVGGNGLLARIGALYHDIGKTAAPEHFVENQRGKNPHDRLNPSQSAKIIISHVTYGTKLAKEMGLPARIVDFIPQHHGTRTLHYFLTKAKTEAGKGEDIHEDDFRYPGPKPQFKESAIMMIADSCEAAARSLSEPNPENIRFIVTKIIDAILADDQLGECDLTLRELTQIRESMIKSLISIYHSRVDYPGYTPPSKSVQNIVIPKDVLDEPRGTLYMNPADIPISKGGEIEDEAVITSTKKDTKAKDAAGD